MTVEGSPLELFLGGFVGQSATLLAVVATVYVVVWWWGARWFAPARIHTKRKADGRQIRSEIGHSLATFAVGAAQATAVTLLYRAGVTKLTLDGEGWTFGWIALSVAALVLLNDAWFYACHRLLHHPRVFPYVHAVHHRSVDVNPFTSYSFHVLEGFLVSAWIVPVVLIFPMCAPVLGVTQVVGTANNVMSHLGYELYPRWLLRIPGLKWLNTATFHSLHHTQFHGNYGLFFRFWDRLLGTEVPGYEAAFLGRGRPVEAGSGWRAARVESKVVESPSTSSFVLDLSGTRLEPGQFVQVRRGGVIRSYSWSHPTAARFTVKRVPGGRVSGDLLDAVSVGDTLEVRGPFGAFGSALPARGRVLFVAGGSGITPFGSLAPEAVKRGLSARLVAVFRDAGDAPLLAELRAVPGLDVHAHFDAASGRLDARALGALLGERPDGVWVCGPEGLAALVREVVAAAWPGVPVVEERFVAAAVHAESARRVTVVQGGRRSELRVEPGATLLDAARAASVELPAGCEQGACGTCRLRVREGQVDVPEGACLTAQERRAGYTLACVGVPRDGAVVEAA